MLILSLAACTLITEHAIAVKVGMGSALDSAGFDSGGDTSLSGDSSRDSVADSGSDADTDTDSDSDTDTDTDTDTDSGFAPAPTDYTATNGSQMIGVPAGSFEMGCKTGRDDLDTVCATEENLHNVSLTRSLWIGETEITRAEWDADTVDHAGWGYYADACSPTGSCPANMLSWQDAAKYANWLSEQEGLEDCYAVDGLAAVDEADPSDCRGYRMPTEAEWEYAARGATDDEYSGSDVVGDVAWYAGSSSHVVSTKVPNAWTLYDLSGNEGEWGSDAWDGMTAYPGDATNPVGTGGSGRVVRGGCWGDGALNERVAYRDDRPTTYQSNCIGLRLARTAP